MSCELQMCRAVTRLPVVRVIAGRPLLPLAARLIRKLLTPAATPLTATHPCSHFPPPHPQEPVRCVAVVSGSGGRVVSGSIDTTLRVWSLADGSKLHKLKGHSAPIRALVAIPSSVSGEGPEGGPTGLSLVASASDDGSIRVWDVEAGALQYALLGARLGAHFPSSFSFPPLATPRRHWHLCCHDSFTSGCGLQAEPLVRLVYTPLLCPRLCRALSAGHSGPVSAICVLPGHRLVSGSWDRLVVVWSLTSGSAERVMEGHRGPVQAVCGASRGRVVSASLDKRIRLWLVATGACERVFDIGRQLGATALATLDATRFVECTGASVPLERSGMSSHCCVSKARPRTVLSARALVVGLSDPPGSRRRRMDPRVESGHGRVPPDEERPPSGNLLGRRLWC